MTNFTVDGLDHVHVAVRDRRAAAGWYARVLGLVPAPEHAAWAKDPQGPLFLATPAGAHCLALFQRQPDTAGDHTVAFRGGRRRLSPLPRQARAAGLERPARRRRRPVGRGGHGGARSLYFCDPDGNRIELTTYDPVAVEGPGAAE